MAGGDRVVVVTSGAIAAGWSALGAGGPRPTDPAVLQAVSAVGQPRLMRTWQDGLSHHGLLAGQVLLAPLDFGHRQQYLHARGTLSHLLELGVVPVVNENDPVADEEIRFGDNDRLSALVAHLVGADLLVLLTDTAGLFTADPRLVEEASLIEEVLEIDARLEEVAGGPGTRAASGGMASKLAAAKIATWSGVEAVIADGKRPGVLERGGGRRGRGGDGLPAPLGAARRPQALDRLRPALGRLAGGRRRGPGGPGRRGPVAAGRRGGGGHRLLRARRGGGGGRPRRGGVRQGDRPLPRPRGRPSGWDGAPRTSPTTSPARSSTATTWSSSDQDGRRPLRSVPESHG